MLRLNILGYKGYFVLSNISKQHYSLIDEVVIAKDSSIQNDYFNESVAFCKAAGLKHYERNKEPKCKSDYIILIGWRWLVDDITKLAIIHDSLLPKYRGFNPLVTALINGDKYIGATCIAGHTEYDKGEILGQKKVKISYPIKIKTAIELVSDLYIELLNDLLQSIKEKQLTSKPQNEEKATYSLWRDEDDYAIDWSEDSEKIKRFIDAVGFPYLGAKTKLNDSFFRILDAEIITDVKIENRVAGKVIFKDEKGLTVVCGKGLIRIKELYHDDGKLFDYSNKFRLKFQ
jgi:methionyl-tRNA formyltransferase